ncbi:MAG: HIT family protein [Bacteroidetes bacterium]|jgi:histidine triad (HIT) family protein|nr:HIT family protein [Bacteroidota bacterium]MBK7039292.1 HIT family protein [Bacteroidota bacterium]MBK7588178.1 HIT family protein [Bacteroidota bacterium]MBK8329068.1 HIT family protein [Bacteroidota bacterium]MBK9301010.1 HIT family protein [Bacteroidota bacterium]
MESIFTKIIDGSIPCFKIKEDEHFIAFLDINPIALGHTLVVPKVQVDKIFDLSDQLLSEALVFAKPIAKALEKTMDCQRCGISVIGLEVPHAHIHLVPIQTADDLNFTRTKLTLSMDTLKQLQETILQAL